MINKKDITFLNILIELNEMKMLNEKGKDYLINFLRKEG